MFDTFALIISCALFTYILTDIFNDLLSILTYDFDLNFFFFHFSFINYIVFQERQYLITPDDVRYRGHREKNDEKNGAINQIMIVLHSTLNSDRGPLFLFGTQPSFFQFPCIFNLYLFMIYYVIPARFTISLLRIELSYSFTALL